MLSPHRNGQSLILVVVLVGGILMVVTAVAGLLTFYQLQQAGDVGRSVEAIFAADAGLEQTLRFLSTNEFPSVCKDPDPPAPCGIPQFPLAGSLPNGATYEGSFIARSVPGHAGQIIRTLSATARDVTGRTIRALQTVLLPAN